MIVLCIGGENTLTCNMIEGGEAGLMKLSR